MQLFANNAAGVLAGAISAAATSMTLQAGQGARFPALAGGDTFTVTLFQIINGVEANYEIVKVTALAGDTMTIVRAQENTTARAYGVGDQVSMRATANTLANFAQKGSPVVFTQTVAVPNVAAGDNTTNAANTAFVTGAVSTAVANLVNSSPATLDTLKELADAIGDDPNYAATTATALGNRLRVDVNTQGLSAQQKANAATNLGLDQVNNTSDANKPVSSAQQTALNLKQDASAKDASGGFAGLTLFAINMKNALGTIVSKMTNAATAARTYTFPDKDITVAGTTNETHVNPTIKAYVEQLQAINTGVAFTINTANGTLIEATIAASVAITLPAPVAGVSYTLIVLPSGGAYSPSFTGGGTLKWAGGTAPAATAVNGKMDKYVFTCGAAYTLGQDGGRNF